jgi:RNA polymerase sigma-70 factor (ECF subfamily)
MYTTDPALLERLRRPGQPEAWTRFVALYTPLLHYWARHHGLENQDAEDLVQEVLTLLVQTLPGFAYRAHGSFRSWLYTVTLNKLRDRTRRRALPITRGSGQLTRAADSYDAAWFTEEEHRQYLVRRALEIMRREFEPTTWKACWEFVAAGRPAAEVAAGLGISQKAVYMAKYRVLRRLRQELAGLLD